MPLQRDTLSADAQVVISRARTILHQSLLRVSQARNVVGLALDLAREKNRLTQALEVLHAKDPLERQLVLQEVQLAYLREPTRLTGARERTELLRAWTELLMDAAEKVESDWREGEIYAELAGGEPEDEAVADAIAHATAENWRDE